LVVAQAEQWQRVFRAQRGETFLHLGDEFYLMCGLPVPAAEIYDGYPQIEDGIGITRHMLENLRAFLRHVRPNSLLGARGTVACGTLIDATMREAINDLNLATGAQLTVVPLENGFFGPEINISGLLTGSDLLRLGERLDGDAPLYISSRMISDRTGTFLDDMTVVEVQSSVGRPLVPCLTLSDVARDIRMRERHTNAA
jgi:NifB/MoaA-like Fe-S oxidoreductase